jgi:hypothetical protein
MKTPVSGGLQEINTGECFMVCSRFSTVCFNFCDGDLDFRQIVILLSTALSLVQKRKKTPYG